MYSRVTPFELDTVRLDLAEAVDRFDDLVVPALREQPGFEGVYVLVNPDGKGLVVSLWASRNDAEAGLRSGFYAAQVELFVTVFRAPAGREGYDVVVAEPPVLAPR
jgi:heme-degrading monooxygenase HmoA